MSEKEQKQWYVIRAIGGKEKKVKEYIETEVQNSHLEDYISQVLIPTEKVYQIKNGKKSAGKGLLSGLCIVEEAARGRNPFMLRNTPNVLGFLGDTKASSMVATSPPSGSEPGFLGRVDELSVSEEETAFLSSSKEKPSRLPGPILKLFGYDRGGGQTAEETHGFREDIQAQDSMELSFMQVEKNN